MPELTPMIGCEQNAYHAFDVWGHTLETIKHAPPNPTMRWAALLHDAGKPSAKFTDPTGKTKFHGHEELSVDLASRILNRLKASNQLMDETLALIKHHGVVVDDHWSNAACRRLLHRLDADGLDWQRWASLQLADRMGKGINQEEISKKHTELLDRFRAIAEKAPPLNVQALAIDGHTVMRLANRPGGPWVGELQRHLLEIVMDTPEQNEASKLELLAKEWIMNNSKCAAQS
jgi:tRNA nucleotidyltransferase/poly(A) polymerase